MNWIGGARARAQNQAGGFLNPSRPAEGGDGDRYTRNTGARGGDVALNPNYRLLNTDTFQQRTVPLVEFVKEKFKNGDAMALMLTHQMEIDITRPNKRRRFAPETPSQIESESGRSGPTEISTTPSSQPKNLRQPLIASSQAETSQPLINSTGASSHTHFVSNDRSSPLSPLEIMLSHKLDRDIRQNQRKSLQAMLSQSVLTGSSPMTEFGSEVRQPSTPLASETISKLSYFTTTSQVGMEMPPSISRVAHWLSQTSDEATRDEDESVDRSAKSGDEESVVRKSSLDVDDVTSVESGDSKESEYEQNMDVDGGTADRTSGDGKHNDEESCMEVDGDEETSGDIDGESPGAKNSTAESLDKGDGTGTSEDTPAGAEERGGQEIEIHLDQETKDNQQDEIVDKEIGKKNSGSIVQNPEIASRKEEDGQNIDKPDKDETEKEIETNIEQPEQQQQDQTDKGKDEETNGEKGVETSQ